MAKVNKLINFIKESEYIHPIEQPEICSQFGLPYHVSLFQKEYRQRFYDYLATHTTTCAQVSKDTNIDHKYLCQCKAYFEKRGLLKVLFLGRCPAYGSNHVQFLTTNKELIDDPDAASRFTNQLNLFT